MRSSLCLPANSAALFAPNMSEASESTRLQQFSKNSKCTTAFFSSKSTAIVAVGASERVVHPAHLASFTIEVGPDSFSGPPHSTAPVEASMLDGVNLIPAQQSFFLTNTSLFLV